MSLFKIAQNLTVRQATHLSLAKSEARGFSKVFTVSFRVLHFGRKHASFFSLFTLILLHATTCQLQQKPLFLSTETRGGDFLHLFFNL